MSILSAFTKAGFPDASIVGEAKGQTVMRIRTGKGWAYERFRDEAEALAWIARNKTEIA